MTTPDYVALLLVLSGLVIAIPALYLGQGPAEEREREKGRQMTRVWLRKHGGIR